MDEFKKLIPTRDDIKYLLYWVVEKAHHVGPDKAVEMGMEFAETLLRCEDWTDPQLLNSEQIWEVIYKATDEVSPVGTSKEKFEARCALIEKYLKTIFWQEKQSITEIKE